MVKSAKAVLYLVHIPKFQTSKTPKLSTTRRQPECLLGMAAILAVMFSSYSEGREGGDGPTAAASVRGCGMWGGLGSVARARAVAAADVQIEGEQSHGLKDDTGRLLIDQV